MNNIYEKLENLAKSPRIQNLFAAAKEISGIRLFHNSYDFSRLQEIYLLYLYNFDCINRDIIIDKISKQVLDNKIYWDSYLIWKQKKPKKNTKENKLRELNCVVTNKIKFPPKEIN